MSYLFTVGVSLFAAGMIESHDRPLEDQEGAMFLMGCGMFLGVIGGVGWVIFNGPF